MIRVATIFLIGAAIGVSMRADLYAASSTPFGGIAISFIYECASSIACEFRCSSEPGSEDAFVDYSDSDKIRKIAITDYRPKPQSDPLRCIQVWFASGRATLHTHLPASLHCTFGPGLQKSISALPHITVPE